MEIKTYKQLVKLDEKGNIYHIGQLEESDTPIEEVLEHQILNKAQEIANFNRSEIDILKSFKAGEYYIERKIIC